MTYGVNILHFFDFPLNPFFNNEVPAFTYFSDQDRERYPQIYNYWLGYSTNVTNARVGLFLIQNIKNLRITPTLKHLIDLKAKGALVDEEILKEMMTRVREGRLEVKLSHLFAEYDKWIVDDTLERENEKYWYEGNLGVHLVDINKRDEKFEHLFLKQLKFLENDVVEKKKNLFPSTKSELSSIVADFKFYVFCPRYSTSHKCGECRLIFNQNEDLKWPKPKSSLVINFPGDSFHTLEEREIEGSENRALECLFLSFK